LETNLSDDPAENKKTRLALPRDGFLDLQNISLDLLGDKPLSSANCLHSLHPLLDGGFREVRPLLKLLQNPRPLILFLESSESPIDRLVLLDYDTNQVRSPRFVVGWEFLVALALR
jgi:hypothetical protein